MNRGSKIVGIVANATGNEQKKQDNRDGSERDRTDLERECSLIGRTPHHPIPLVWSASQQKRIP
jgi:hypothetical protein